MRKLALILTVCAPGAAMSQPFSQSMTDCAALYQAISQMIRSEQDAYRLMYSVNKWADAAVVQAKAEGKSTDFETTWAEIEQKTTKWEERGKTFYFTQEFRDWAAYCRKFAKHAGVEIDP